MHNQKKISVIIPVFNTEGYLTICLESLLNQTFDDFEIICINDGSTDNSLKILENFASKFDKIKIFSQDNQGVSAARNRGIKEAVGDYLIFLDSDDFLNKDCLEKSYQEIIKTGADILCFGLNRISTNSVVPSKDSTLLYKYEKSNNIKMKDMISFLDSAASKLIRKKFVVDNEIEFPVGIKCCEDGVFNLLCYYNNPKYAFLNEYFYNYVTHRNSSVTNNGKNAIKNDIDAYMYMINSEKFRGVCVQYKVLTLQKFLGGIKYYWKKKENKKYRRKYLAEIKLFREFLYKNIDKKTLLKVPNMKFINNSFKLEFDIFKENLLSMKI